MGESGCQRELGRRQGMRDGSVEVERQRRMSLER